MQYCCCTGGVQVVHQLVQSVVRSGRQSHHLFLPSHTFYHFSSVSPAQVPLAGADKNKMVKLSEDMIVARTRVSDMNQVKKLNCWGAELSDIAVIRKLRNVEVLSLR